MKTLFSSWARRHPWIAWLALALLGPGTLSAATVSTLTGEVYEGKVAFDTALTITPARSRPMTWTSEGKPGVAMHSVLGRRGAASPITTPPADFRRSAAASRPPAWACRPMV